MNDSDRATADWIGDGWGGLAAMLVALPAAIAFGVAIFSPLAGSLAAQGALAGMLGAMALGILAPLFGSRSRLISAPSAPAAAVLAALAATFTGQGGDAATILVQIALIGLLTGGIQIGFGFAKIVLLQGGIELNNSVAGFDHLAGLAEGRDGSGIGAGGRHDDHFGIASLECASCGHRNSDAAAPDLSGRQIRDGLGGDRLDEFPGGEGRGCDNGQDSRDDQDAEFHFLASFLVTSASATVAPGAMPEMATS